MANNTVISPYAFVQSQAFVVAASSTYGANTFTVPNGGTAVSLMLTVGAHPCQVQFDGLAGSVFTLLANATYSWGRGDINFKTLAFDNSQSGASSTTVQVVAGYVL